MHISLKAGAAFFLPDTEGTRIRERVRPLEGETIIVKHFPDGFLHTELRETLNAQCIERLVVCDMMSHMCVDTTVRSAKGLGYTVILLGDACTTKDLTWKGERIPARTVHNAFIAALHGTFAAVIDTEELEKTLG
jgi:nicotinamidase-related amidase